MLLGYWKCRCEQGQGENTKSIKYYRFHGLPCSFFSFFLCLVFNPLQIFQTFSVTCYENWDANQKKNQCFQMEQSGENPITAFLFQPQCSRLSEPGVLCAAQQTNRPLHLHCCRRWKENGPLLWEHFSWAWQSNWMDQWYGGCICDRQSKQSPLFDTRYTSFSPWRTYLNPLWGDLDFWIC